LLEIDCFAFLGGLLSAYEKKKSAKLILGQNLSQAETLLNFSNRPYTHYP